MLDHVLSFPFLKLFDEGRVTSHSCLTKNSIISGWRVVSFFVEAPDVDVLKKKKSETTKQASSEMLIYIGKNYINRQRHGRA